MTAHTQATYDLWKLSAQPDATAGDDLTGIELDTTGDLAQYRTCDDIGTFSPWQPLPAWIDEPGPCDDLADVVQGLALDLGQDIDAATVVTGDTFATWQA